MKVAAARAIAACVHDDELRPDYIVPSVFDRTVAPAVAGAVRQAAEADRRGQPDGPAPSPPGSQEAGGPAGPGVG
jgi:malate dehydrogenase (oxaloacetate-decarboxylating)